jgi:hypothetical protein
MLLVRKELFMVRKMISDIVAQNATGSLSHFLSAFLCKILIYLGLTSGFLCE